MVSKQHKPVLVNRYLQTRISLVIQLVTLVFLVREQFSNACRKQRSDSDY